MVPCENHRITELKLRSAPITALHSQVLLTRKESLSPEAHVSLRH